MTLNNFKFLNLCLVHFVTLKKLIDVPYTYKMFQNHGIVYVLTLLKKNLFLVFFWVKKLHRAKKKFYGKNTSVSIFSFRND